MKEQYKSMFMDEKESIYQSNDCSNLQKNARSKTVMEIIVRDRGREIVVENKALPFPESRLPWRKSPMSSSRFLPHTASHPRLDIRNTSRSSSTKPNPVVPLSNGPDQSRHERTASQPKPILKYSPRRGDNSYSPRRGDNSCSITPQGNPPGQSSVQTIHNTFLGTSTCRLTLSSGAESAGSAHASGCGRRSSQEAELRLRVRSVSERHERQLPADVRVGSRDGEHEILRRCSYRLGPHTTRRASEPSGSKRVTFTDQARTSTH